MVETKRGTELRRIDLVSTLYYVLNLHVARGVVPARALPKGGKGPWRESWPQPAYIADWFDAPLNDVE